jgi:hypothetical protein
MGERAVSGASVVLAKWISVPRRALVAAAVLSLALGAALYGGLLQGSPTAPAGTSSSSFGGLLRLPLAAQGPASAALGSAEPAYLVSTHGGKLSANTPSQGLTSRFSGAGVAVSAHAAQLQLGLRAIGYGSSLSPLSAVAPSAHGNRVVFAHPGVTESYTNGPLGLEQGFTVARPATASQAGPLTLSMAFTTADTVTVAPGGQSVALAHGGHDVLRYTGLRATDARGHRLASWLELASGRLLLRVDAAGAKFPLQVDPFLQQGSELKGGGEVGAGRFGASVAISEDGNTALIGAPKDATEAGAAWVFTRTAGTWTQQGSKLTGSGATGSAHFGTSVALSGDGNTALVGGPSDNTNVGAAWVFTRSGSTWTQQGSKLTGSGEISKGQFGTSVALSGDGKTALVGGSHDNVEAGAAWVFTRSGSTWTQQGSKLTGAGESEEGGFGASVALSEDGSTALIGGPKDSGELGAAWVFTRTGETWSQQGSKLTGAGGVKKPEFGASVALSADGNTAMVGGPGDNTNAGAVWAFGRSGETWSPEGSKITPSGEQGAGMFGASVALSHEATTALIGGDEDHGELGAAWIFTRSGEVWSQQGSKLTDEEEEEVPVAGEFGDAVALSGDGATALIGARFDAAPKVSGAGGAFVFFNGGPVPIVVTHAASGISATAATLNATVNPDGENVTDCHFEYGTTTAYGSSVPCGSLPGSGNSPVAVSASVSSLTTGSTYHFRISATNAAGTNLGHDASFKAEVGLKPTVSKISPNKGLVTGKATVTITGTHFGGVTAVHFGSVAVEPGKITFNSETSLTVESPPNTSTTVPVTVTTPNGTSESSKKSEFKYGKPVVSGVSPKMGPKAGGTTVTVTGAGFALGNTTMFLFKKTPGTSVNCVSTTECTVVSPANSGKKTPETVDIIAVIGKNKSPKGAGDQFSFE